MYQAPNAPQSIGGVLDSGFKLFRESFVQVFLLAVLASLATSPGGYLAAYLGVAPSLGATVAALLAFAAILIVTLVLTSAMVVRIDAIAHGQTMSAADALGAGARRAPATLGAGILLGLAVLAIPFVGAIVVGVLTGLAGLSPVLAGLALLPLIVPASIIAIWLFFGPYAAIVDRLGPVTSLQYSRALTRGHWWRTAALVTVIAIILMAVYVVLGIMATIAAVANPEAIAAGQMPWYIQFVISPLLSGIAMPLSYALFLAIYYDLRLRREGGDLAARIAAAA